MPQVWRPGVDALGEGEELDYDPSAYDCLHSFQLEWPCLRCARRSDGCLSTAVLSHRNGVSRRPRRPCSFDILRDELGESRIQFPHAMYMVAGSQADAPGNNALTVARLTQLSKMRNEDDDSEDSEDSDEEGDASRQPVLQSRSIAHHGCALHARISRVRDALTRMRAGA